MFIPDPGPKRFRIPDQNNRILVFLTQKMVLSSRKNDLDVHPGSGSRIWIRDFSIPDPGSRSQKGTGSGYGSATLHEILVFRTDPQSAKSDIEVNYRLLLYLGMRYRYHWCPLRPPAQCRKLCPPPWPRGGGVRSVPAARTVAPAS